MEIGEYFLIQLLVWWTTFFPQNEKCLIFSGQLIWVGAGLELVVSKAVFWAFFEVSLLVTLEPHVGHTKVTDFSTLS